MIPNEAYEELVEAVGPEYVSDEPAVLDGYAWQPSFNVDPDIWIPRPEAVVLPASTEEVQAVVRLCNEHGMKYKPFSTGWGAHAGPTGEGVIQLDLRRMDRILEIDERNMYAVVEPYAVGSQIQAEAMKVGLNTHIIGAGPACSPLASACSGWGPGWDGPYMSSGSRNLMGVEWVLPTGELLRLGSLGSGGGWFSADGPGPSLRGAMRGYYGAFGGNGVFTKCALKLFNWPGPPNPEVSGTLFDVKANVPEGLKLYMCFFPDEKAFADAGYRIGEAQIGYLGTKTSLGGFLLCFTPHLLRKMDGMEALRTMLSRSLKYLLIYMLTANSPGEMEYQELTVREIVSECGGIAMELLHETPALGSMLWMNLIRVTMIPLVYRFGGQFSTGWGKDETWDAEVAFGELTEETKKEWIEKDGMLDDMADCAWMTQYEDTAWTHCEQVFEYDPRNKKHLEAILPIGLDFTINSLKLCMEQGLNFDPRFRKLFSPMEGSYGVWQKKVAEAFDPVGAADSTLYIGEDDFDLSGIDPTKLEKLAELVAKYTWTESGPPE
ncbi:MAG: FAD-binding oxidoreductase [Actinomycetota bacterium]|nr:FAD-binding oxidoreductase [Actinomycetota bacterium]